MTSSRTLAVSALSILICACANIKAPPPQPSMANVNSAKTMSSAVKLGPFKLRAGLSSSIDESISVRGANTLKPPSGSTFSGYLRDVLMTELRAANKLDEASHVAITGELTASELDAGMSTGTATLGARFAVTGAGGVCFDKELVATDQWDSSFVGAVAVPTAFNHYTALYAVLAGKLLADPDFRQHCLTSQ